MHKKTNVLFCLALWTVACLWSGNGFALAIEDQSEQVESGENEVALLDDCNVPYYGARIDKYLESKLHLKPEFSKDWALTNFIVKRNGAIEQPVVANSTGNDKLNTEAVRVLRSTKLPALPAECPDQVRVTHAFNYRKAWKNSPVASKPDEQSEDSAEESTQSDSFLKRKAKNFAKHIHQLGKEDKDDTSSELSHKLEHITENLAIIIAAILVLSIFTGGAGALIFSFFTAGTIWWLHRIFLGRFPS